MSEVVVRLEGQGLHGGQACAVSLSRAEGPTRLAADGREAPLSALRVLRADSGVLAQLGEQGPQIELVEHLLSVVGVLSCFEGLRVAVEGGEIPLLDGGALAFFDAIAPLSLLPSAPARILRPFVFEHGASRYELCPGDERVVEVAISFAHPAIGEQTARWEGSAEDFRARIAPARTFGFLRDHAALLAAGRARGASPGSVLIYDDEGPLSACEPVLPGEPALHKLLDLVGDLALHGGPFVGTVRATRPGHGATLAAMRAARAEGILTGGVVLGASSR